MKKAKIVKTLTNGALKLEIRKYHDGRYGFDWATDIGERKQIRLHDLKDAEQRAKELLGATKAGTVDLLKIDPEEYAEFLRWKAQKGEDALVSDLVRSFLAMKQGEGLSIWTMRDLKQLETFGTAFQQRISTLTGEQVRAWLDGLEIGPRRWNNLLAAVKSLFRYARDNEYISETKTSVEKIQKKRRVSKDVETYTVDEFRQLLDAVDREWLPTIVLGGFAGIRPQECAPDPRDRKPGLMWENILWHKNKIDVPKTVAKDRRRRFVPLCDAAAAFLSDWRNARGPVAPQGVRFSNVSRLWVAKLNENRAQGEPEWRWKDDGLRHSYASYRLAITEDMPALSLEMGNSVKMIHDHYLDLKHTDEASEWFGLRPSGVEAGKIIAIA